jgi:hypothetical protein
MNSVGVSLSVCRHPYYVFSSSAGILHFCLLTACCTVKLLPLLYTKLCFASSFMYCMLYTGLPAAIIAALGLPAAIIAALQ